MEADPEHLGDHEEDPSVEEDKLEDLDMLHWEEGGEWGGAAGEGDG